MSFCAFSRVNLVEPLEARAGGIEDRVDVLIKDRTGDVSLVGDPHDSLIADGGPEDDGGSAHAEIHAADPGHRGVPATK